MRSAAIIALLVLLSAPAAARAQPDLPRQDLTMRFTTAAPGKSTGTRVSILFRDPSDRNGKPIPVRREVFTFPRGTRFDPSVVPACDASSEELMVLGESACPAESRIGGGTATGVSGTPFDPIPLDIAGFENGGGLSLLTTVRPLGFRFVARAVRDGRTLTVEYPRAPGGPPDGQTALREVHNQFHARSVGRRAYVRTPAICPRSRRWKFVGRFTYSDGVTETAVSMQRCRKHARRDSTSRRRGARSPALLG